MLLIDILYWNVNDWTHHSKNVAEPYENKLF